MSGKQKIVPPLRFPEFKEKWEINMLGNKKISFFPNDKTPINKLEIETYVSTENLLPNYGGVKQSNKLPDSGSLTSYQKGDILVANIRPYLKKVWIADRSGAASNDVIVFRKGTSISEDYLQHILKNDLFINYVMKGAKGVKMPRGDKSLIKKYPVCFPSNPSEQQKIAACLSSLDEVITAETEKLDLLQDHKKGLLQQLFPAEGETQPKFRFPEFKEDGDWEIDNFSSFIKLYRGSSPRPINQYTTEDENGVNWIKIGDTKNANGFKISKVEEKITVLGSKKSRKVKRGELILANSMSYGATYELDIEGCIYDGWFVLREFEESFDKNFLLQLLNSNYLQSQYKRLAAGGIVQNISSEIVYATLLPKPSIQEQQKIAACLSAADELIEAQTQKIEALQQHKKGLLQQLFQELTIEMDRFKNKYRIASARAPFWDYGWNAAYFVTICTHHRHCYFGKVVNGEMQLSDIGKIAELQWLKTFEIRPDMNLWMGSYVVMPNHFHAIIGIGQNQYNSQRDSQRESQRGRDAMHCVSTNATNTNATNTNGRNTGNGTKNKFGPQSKNLASIIRGFKIGVTKNARLINPNFKWQSRYHDHIIRDRKSFHTISNYIINNPMNWKEDKFNTSDE